MNLHVVHSESDIDEILVGVKRTKSPLYTHA